MDNKTLFLNSTSLWKLFLLLPQKKLQKDNTSMGSERPRWSSRNLYSWKCVFHIIRRSLPLRSHLLFKIGLLTEAFWFVTANLLSGNFGQCCHLHTVKVAVRQAWSVQQLFLETCLYVSRSLLVESSTHQEKFSDSLRKTSNLFEQTFVQNFLTMISFCIEFRSCSCR